MRHILAVALILGCGSSEPARTPPPEPKTAPIAITVEDVAMRFATAALAGDRATALSLTLTFDEMTKLSKKALERADWDAEIKDLLDKLAKEGAGYGGTITGAKVVKTRSLDPATDEKVRQRTDVAIVQLTVMEKDGEGHASPFPWFFVRTAAGWKYSPRQ